MPTVYKRKPGAKPRGLWDPDRLKEAIARIQAGEVSFREAERLYGVPARTIKRRLDTGKVDAPGHGPSSCLGPENEERLVRHIKALGDAGFCPDQTTVRKMAYEFAVALNIDHKFNNDKKSAGYDWSWSFMRRHPDLSVRKAEGLSIARGKGLTREAAKHFYDLLEKEMTTHNLLDKPQNLFNVDESGIQLINKVGKVVAKKGAKVVQKITTGEKGETVSMVACCSAEGRFLPPVLIYKGKNLKPEFEDGLPPGSKVFMNQKSAYINSDIFYKWFRDHFLPRRAPNRNILILDGHVSHCSSVALLELAELNEVTLLCLPPHTTHALQPLDVSFFASFKSYFTTASNRWVEQHIGRKLTRYQAGPLIREAWDRSASVGNGTSGFRYSGIFPLNKDSLPDHVFSISDNMVVDSDRPTPNQPTQQQIGLSQTNGGRSPVVEPQPGCSKDSYGPAPEGTPSKYLKQISPIPQLKSGKPSGRAKIGAVVLTSKENIFELKRKSEEKQEKESRKQQKLQNKSRPKPKLKPKKRKLSFSSDSEGLDEDIDFESDDEKPKSSKAKAETKRSLNSCKECGEFYHETKKRCDWLACAMCKQWLHDDCTIFDMFCVDCGREDRRKNNN